MRFQSYTNSFLEEHLADHLRISNRFIQFITGSKQRNKIRPVPHCNQSSDRKRRISPSAPLIKKKIRVDLFATVKETVCNTVGDQTYTRALTH